MQITGVGSRIVIQAGAVIAVIFGLVGKIGGLFASMPQAMVSGLFCVMFALIGELSPFAFVPGFESSREHSSLTVYDLEGIKTSAWPLTEGCKSVQPETSTDLM